MMGQYALRGTNIGSAGRGPKGRLRNFQAMGKRKFEAVYEQVMAEGNDAEAMVAVVQALAEVRNAKLLGQHPEQATLDLLKSLGVFEE